MTQFEYRTISMPMPVEENEFAEEVAHETKRVEDALRRGEEPKVKPWAIPTKEYLERLNREGRDGWQVVGIMPGAPRSLFGCYGITVTLMREIPEPLGSQTKTPSRR